HMDKMILRAGGILGVLLTCGALSGCITTSGMAFGAASGGMAARGVGHDFKYYLFDVPPQVIYRIDDHRFFTLENYKDCGHGGLAYYHDTKKKIKEYVGGGSDSNSLLKPNPLMSWKGKLIYAASDNVMVYIERFPMMSDRDTHSGVFLSYEIGGEYGKVQVGDDTDPGIGITILVTDERVYVGSQGGSREDVYNIPAKSADEINNYNNSVRASDFVTMADWPDVLTPSGQIRFTCDATIRPVKTSVTPEQVYASDATGVPVNDQ
ncbi:T6SS immunity protein Tli3 family protein, partial [Pantoea sp. C2G6]|uniref:T6SS immunity protein Tli3 family protein n=1 Tax=Pantoea sp. C2G6 TaxID=3243084 RepID=UPI003ED9197B